MRRGFCGALLAAAGIVCAGEAPADARDAALASPEARVVKTARYRDAAREVPDAPDIRTVVVSNTEAVRPSATTITFRIEIASRPVLTEDMSIGVGVDADDDARTGLPAQAAFPGADYLVVWDPAAVGQDADLLRCRRACETAVAPTFRSSYARGPTFSLQAADLGDTRRFRFAVRAFSGPAGDFAPAEGSTWSYALLFRKPAAPRGSRTLTVRFTVTRADGSVLTSGRVSCTATIGTRRFRPRSARFVGERATCVFVLPLSAVGKTIRGTITVASGGARFTKPFERTIR
jgi:hypothetical protein